MLRILGGTTEETGLSMGMAATDRSDDGGRRAPRGPGIIYTGLTAVAAVVLAIVALTAQQPPPPTIAEFAPQAQEQIEDAPLEQVSDFGSGQGAPGGDGGSTGPAPEEVPEPEVIDVARVRRCVGDPPRQVEDPQAPPCVPYWDGDNGGATWRGVTGTEIRIALPTSGDEECGSSHRSMERFFNTRFEFYGRQIRLFCFAASDQDAATVRSHVEYVDKEIGAFASSDYEVSGNTEMIYYDGLARTQILSVDVRSLADEEHRSRLQPYQWGYHPAVDRVGRNLAEFACAGLHGETAEHAAPPTSTELRSFGFIYAVKHGFSPDVEPILTGLERCGIDPVVVASDDPASQAPTVMTQMRSEGVTSIMCFCPPFDTQFFHQAADKQGYGPEWIVTSAMQGDEELFMNLSSATQRARMFGISFWNKRLRAQDLPAYWALKEVNPDYQEVVQGGTWNFEIYTYKPLLHLASGIQMAGPNLTPETFQQGLFGAQFPNPGCGGPPYYQGCVTFGHGNRSMNQDAGMIWWSESESGFGGQGSWCYAHDGERFGEGSWPEGRQPFFDRSVPCR